MSYGHRLAIYVAASMIGHAVLAGAAGVLTEDVERPRPEPATVDIEILPPPAPAPAPAPAPEPEPEPEPAPAPAPRERVTTTPRKPSRSNARSTAAVSGDDTGHGEVAADVPKFGVTMTSSSGGDGPQLPRGKTLAASPAASGTSAKPSAAVASAPVEAHVATRMPLPRGRCRGRYTEAARDAGIEGTVVLDLVVGKTGRTRDIRVVSGLGHGLTRAAIAAAKACKFSPGERAGRRIAVRVRSFKIRFELRDGN